ncbi:hypothetical protein FB451DRAFT_1188969 [Mycena latifolia]|nr:hypothetical protein FB451DRAFT_1188969 [Mycena latifolia]
MAQRTQLERECMEGGTKIGSLRQISKGRPRDAELGVRVRGPGSPAETTERTKGGMTKWHPEGQAFVEAQGEEDSEWEYTKSTRAKLGDNAGRTSRLSRYSDASTSTGSAWRCQPSLRVLGAEGAAPRQFIYAPPLVPRITLVPTATSGVPASSDTVSHSHRPDPTQHFQSDKQAKAPVGLIVGVAIAILAAVVGLFLLRYLFIRRARRREAASASASSAAALPPMAKKQGPFPPPPPPQDAGKQLPASERDAVPLTHTHYPPSSAGGSWPTPFAPAAADAPGAGSSPAARQAHLAAELRAAQALLERGGKGVDTVRTRARIRELEERQQSAWALGLE